jgi:hypothetical protein
MNWAKSDDLHRRCRAEPPDHFRAGLKSRKVRRQLVTRPCRSHFVPEIRTDRGFSSTTTVAAISVPSVLLHFANTRSGFHVTLSQDSEEKPDEG